MSNYYPKVINLFGPPCSGKSTLALALSAKMKVMGLRIEYVEEWAKGQTYENNLFNLSNQIKVLGEQHHKLYQVKDKVDWIVTDSPFPMGITYLIEPNPFLDALIWHEFKRYENHNFFLPLMFDYQKEGRNQDEQEAIEKEKQIKALLDTGEGGSYNVITDYKLKKRVNAVLKHVGLK